MNRQKCAPLHDSVVMPPVSKRITVSRRGRDLPIPKNETVSSNMRKMPRTKTKPETELMAALTKRNFKVDVNVCKLPGSPDLVLVRHQTAIYVHGCFWHGCGYHFVLPKHNRSWWAQKIAANKARDRRKAASLGRLGWSVITVWEHEDPERAANRIQRRLRSRKS